MESPSQDGDILYAQLNRLVGELLRGTLSRHCFRPWEIDFLLDLENCKLRPSARRELLQRYRKAVRRHFENESGPPPKFSEFLESRRAKAARKGDAAPTVAGVGSQHLG